MSYAREILEAVGAARRNDRPLPRTELKDDAAEAIAQVADVLQLRAVALRPVDKLGAYHMQIEASYLHSRARTIETEAEERRQLRRAARAAA